MINNNLDYEKNSNNALPTTTAAATSNTTAAHAADNNHRQMASNDNSYFNRFDNRIAANLAAVLNGARFRSSSCSKSSTTAANRRTTTAAAAAKLTTTPPPRTYYHNGSNLNNSNARLHCKDNDKYTTFGSRQSLNNSRPASPCPLRADGSLMGRRRPLHLFTQANPNCNDNEKVAQTPSSDEDNSPTELNNCKRLTDKPPLVKRLTMGLLRGHEESRPLVDSLTTAATTNTSTTTTTTTTATNRTNLPFQPRRNQKGSEQIYSNGYINEEAFEPEKLIASKFGDSCRQSLTAIPMLDHFNFNDNNEFNLKKRYLRETSSANSSPKIFANRLRINASTTARLHAANSSSANCHNMAFDDNGDEDDLKDASWFQAGISRDIAIEVLANKSPGAFLVRKSSSKPGCYALTLRVPAPPGPKIANYIILRTGRGYKIKGFRKEFSSLKALITHHSVMPELLPVPLAMPRPTNMSSSRRNLDDFDTYDSLQMLLKYLRAKNMENE